MRKILLVDDNPDILEPNRAHFERLGYSVTTADTGVKALVAVDREQFDCIVLDIILPDLDGHTVCEAMRKTKKARETPIVFLSCKDEMDDKLKGLAEGDDYITKPYSLEELSARVDSRIRRGRGERNPNPVFDDELHMIRTRSGKLLFLSATQNSVCKLLLSMPGKTFSREELLRAGWGDGNKDGNVLVACMSKLRSKLKNYVEDIGRIESVYGTGYRLTPPEEERG